MTTLVKLTIVKEPDGSWSCTRERATEGETATGMRTLEEVFDYVRAHEKAWGPEQVEMELEEKL